MIGVQMFIDLLAGRIASLSVRPSARLFLSYELRGCISF